MKALKAAGIGLVVSVAGTAAADDLPEELQKCARLQNAEVRLACYDALAGISASRPQQLSSAGEAPAAPVETSATGQSTAGQVEEQESGQSLAQRVFGLLPGREAGDNLLESRVVGEVRNPREGTRFTLENGQVWQQTDRTRRNYRATNPKVEIKEGFMNSYRMRLEGLNGRIRVRRVQ